MSSDSANIVASNLTVAYCLTINRRLGPGTGTISTQETEFSKENILSIYRKFLQEVKGPQKYGSRP